VDIWKAEQVRFDEDLQFLCYSTSKTDGRYGIGLMAPKFCARPGYTPLPARDLG